MHSQFEFDGGALAPGLDEVGGLSCPTEHARLAGQPETDRHHDGRLAGSVRSDHDVELRPGAKLHRIVRPEIGLALQHNQSLQPLSCLKSI